jgi:hypothetical protein
MGRYFDFYDTKRCNHCSHLWERKSVDISEDVCPICTSSDIKKFTSEDVDYLINSFEDYDSLKKKGRVILKHLCKYPFSHADFNSKVDEFLRSSPGVSRIVPFKASNKEWRIFFDICFFSLVPPECMETFWFDLKPEKLVGDKYCPHSIDWIQVDRNEVEIVVELIHFPCFS